MGRGELRRKKIRTKLYADQENKRKKKLFTQIMMFSKVASMQHST